MVFKGKIIYLQILSKNIIISDTFYQVYTQAKFSENAIKNTKKN